MLYFVYDENRLPSLRNSGMTPRYLTRDPIVEATAEIRFTPVSESSYSYLFSALVKELKSELPNVELLQPFGVIPEAVIRQDSSYAFAPRNRISNDEYNVNIGERVINVGCHKPYPGWDNFRPVIERVIGCVAGEGAIKDVVRQSIKYVNVLPTRQNLTPLQLVRLSAKLADFDLVDHITKLRTEIQDREHLNIIEVAGGKVEFKLTREVVEGAILQIDCIREKIDNDFWGKAMELFDDSHDVEKSIFFSVITDETLEACEPVN